MVNQFDMRGIVVLTMIVGGCILLVVVVYIFFKEKEKELEKERVKEYRRINEEKFNSIERSKIPGMYVEEIVSATGCSHQVVFMILYREKIKCRDFDGTISDEEREKIKKIEKELGRLVPQLICPHCQTKGQVHKKMDVTRYETITTSKAILDGKKTTKKQVTQLHCTNCGTAWDI